MIHAAKSIFGTKIQATDKRCGTCQDLLFDDASKKIVYVVVDTGSWLIDRQILLSPQAIGKLAPGDSIEVNLSSKDIEDGPPLKSDAPVSRQAEEKLHRHFGWTPYWDALAPGATGQIMPPPAVTAKTETQDKTQQMAERYSDEGDPNLRSCREVIGYGAHCGGEKVGKVDNICVSDEDWRIVYLGVDIHPWLPRGIRLAPGDQLVSISYLDSSVLLGDSCRDLASFPKWEDYEFPLEQREQQEIDERIHASTE